MCGEKKIPNLNMTKSEFIIESSNICDEHKVHLNFDIISVLSCDMRFLFNSLFALLAVNLSINKKIQEAESLVFSNLQAVNTETNNQKWSFFNKSELQIENFNVIFCIKKWKKNNLQCCSKTKQIFCHLFSFPENHFRQNIYFDFSHRQQRLCNEPNYHVNIFQHAQYFSPVLLYAHIGRISERNNFLLFIISTTVSV